MRKSTFENSKRAAAVVVATSSVLMGCATSEKPAKAINPEDATISSLREEPVASNMPETAYTRAASCSVDIARIATKEVLRLVEGSADEPGVYHIDPSNKQSSYVAIEETAGNTTLKMQVALDRNGQAELGPDEDIVYAIGGEINLMQLSNENWQEALDNARADQVGFANGGMRVLNLSTGEGGYSDQPDSMCEVAAQLR